MAITTRGDRSIPLSGFHVGSAGANGHYSSLCRSGSLVFAKNFLARPKLLGSIIPSSRFLIDRLLKQIDFANAQTIVEFGPGTGCITTELLKRMRPDAKLIAIEMNPQFVLFLQDRVADARLRTVEGSAADVLCILQKFGIEKADYVISGIPFSTMPEQVRQSILQATRDVLQPNGRMLVYQFSKSVLPHLQKTFRQVKCDFEPLNILPARLFYCAKNVN